MLNQELTKLGLNKNEASIYLACLESGPIGIVALAKKADLSRTTLYSSLDKLIEKKLLTVSIKGDRKIYIAEAPEKFRLLLKQKLSKFDELLPELTSLMGKGNIKPKIKYFEGLEGVKKITQQILSAQEDIVIGFAGVEALAAKSHGLIEFWEKEIIPKRKKANKFLKIILPDNPIGKAFKSGDGKGFRESRLVPSSSYNFESEILIYDETINFVSYSKNEEFALSLESKAIANTLKMIWRICWNVGY